LRIDDLDRQRFRLEYLEDIFESLHWLGIHWDKGPKNAQDFLTKYSQTYRMDLYHQGLEKLWKSSHLMYPCSCSRKKIREHWEKLGVEHQGYPGFCRTGNGVQHYTWEDVIHGEDIAWRMYFKTTQKNVLYNAKQHDLENDIVIQLKSGLPAYHLSSVIDDLHYGNNLIVRGLDLERSTVAQIKLSEAMSSIPDKGKSSSLNFADSMFVHHSLILENGEHKLSKSQGSTSLKSLRENGMAAKNVIRVFAKLLGIQGFTGDTLLELVPFFEEIQVPRENMNIEDVMREIYES
jgi:glutamyl-tRNA synthetase